MKFPSRGAVVGVVVTVFLWLIGFPVWLASLFGLMGFLGTGGLQYVKLAVRTLPMDLWMGLRLLNLLRAMRRVRDKRLYVSDLFQGTAAKYPDKVAIYFENRQLTFRELDELSNRIANQFLTHGLQRGACVAMFMENSLEYLAVFLGLSKIGVTAALINYNLRSEALAHCLKISKCMGLVFSSTLSEAVSEVLSELDPAVRGVCYSVGGASTVPEAKSLEDAVMSESKLPPPPVRDKSVNDTLLYIYTSGTTGMPKACKVEDAKLFRSPLFFANAGNITDNDCVYIILPLYHSHGLVHCGGPMIYFGSTLVIRRKFSAKNFWTDCAKYNCTMVCTIGEISRYLLAQPPRPTDTQHKVRLIITAGLRKEIWSEYQTRFNVAHIIEFYGSTEGNLAFINIDNKVGSIGALPLYIPSIQNIHFLKLDPESRELVRTQDGFCVDCGIDEPGEAVCEITKASPYYGYRDEKSSEKKVLRNVFKNGDAYFRTGDIMKMNEENWVYFCDRSGDTFRWRGENVSTTEVEILIATVLDLTDVVVYGVEVPGSEGRAGMAAIVGTEDTIDLPGLPQQLSLSLPPYAVPLFVRLIQTADLTGTFKLQKVRLRKEGFDRGLVSDPLYILRGGSYVPLTEDLHKQLLAGTVRV